MKLESLNELSDAELITRAARTAIPAPANPDTKSYFTGTIFVYDGWLWRASKGGMRVMMRNDRGLLYGERKHLISWLQRNPA